MDNPSRSERTRKAVIQAAIAVITRDGPARLTLDAIAQEAGVSKGGLLHQFPNKMAVLRALLDQELEYFDEFRKRSIADGSSAGPHSELALQLSVLREAANKRTPITLAFMGALAEDSTLLSVVKKRAAARAAAIKKEAADPQLALLRHAAAQGLVLTALFGMSPLSDGERARLFDLLLDESVWSRLSKPKSAKPGNAKAGSPKPSGT